MSLVHELLAWLASLCLLLGGLFSLLGAIGLYRLPDAYSRMHAASKAGALGAMFLLLGAALATAGAWAPKAVLGILVLLLCSPLAAHAIARSAYRAGMPPRLGPLGDALDEASRKRERGRS